MKVAFVPWDSQIHDNNIFIPKYLGYVDSHILLKRTFQEHGDDINTIDMYKNLKEVDLFLFSEADFFEKHLPDSLTVACTVVGNRQW